MLRVRIERRVVDCVVTGVGDVWCCCMSGVLWMLCVAVLSDGEGEGGVGRDELQGTRRSTCTVCRLWD